MDRAVVDAVRNVLHDASLDGSLKAQAISVPGFSVLSQAKSPVHPAALIEARDFVVLSLAGELRSELIATRQTARPTGSYQADRASISGRRLANAALGLLNAADDVEARAMAADQFSAADNMTDSQSALACLCQHACDERDAALASFHERWSDDALVLDKWFALQASSRLTGAETVRALSGHEDFNLANPNRVRSLIGVFAMQNFRGFHAADGSGYEVLADTVIDLDPKNPQVASRLVRALNPWRRFEAPWSGMMKAQLERIAGQEGLSKDVFEIVNSALQG